jgi:hypothetical protein
VEREAAAVGAVTKLVRVTYGADAENRDDPASAASSADSAESSAEAGTEKGA